MTLNGTELALLDRWQRGFPFVSRPFALIGDVSGVSEEAALEIFGKLKQQDVISRVGAVVKPHTLGASTLAAMRVAPDRLDAVADIVSREPLVTHNYQRTHDYNLWFVIAGPDTRAVAATIESIERQTGLPVLDLPLQQAYHLDLGFSLTGEKRRIRRSAQRNGCSADETDRKLLAAIEDGLPIVERPYAAIATQIGLDEESVLARLERLTNAGVVTRFGCVVRHRKLGYTANAMAVWDVSDDQADAIAAAFVQNPRVTLCYRRRRQRPEWPYNLYCMVHATSRDDALAIIGGLNTVCGIGRNAYAVLFSTRCFKQRGAVFSEQAKRVQ